MKQPQNDFLEVVPGQGQEIGVFQQQPTFQVVEQQQQQQNIGSDIGNGDEVPQHPMNPDTRDFLPGHRSASAT